MPFHVEIVGRLKFNVFLTSANKREQLFILQHSENDFKPLFSRPIEIIKYSSTSPLKFELKVEFWKTSLFMQIFEKMRSRFPGFHCRG